MAEDDDDGFSFGDFKFASPPQTHINGVASAFKNDDVWGDFFVSPLTSQSEFNLFNNGFHPSPPNPATTTIQSSIRADPNPNKFQKPNGALPLSLFGELEEEEGDGSNTNTDSNGFHPSSPNLFNNGFHPSPPNPATTTIQSSIRANPNPNKFQKPNGCLPLSLFGELEEEEGNGSNTNTDSNGWFDPDSPSQNGKIGAHKNDDVSKSPTGLSSNFNGVASDLIVDDNNDSNNDDEDDDWEFTGAFSGNGTVEGGNFMGASAESGYKVEPKTKKDQAKQTGQDAFHSVDNKPFSINFLPQSIDFFSASYGDGANNQSSETDVHFKSTASTANTFMWDPFPSIEDVAKGSGISANALNEDDDFDDFGDFVDAFHEAVSKVEGPGVAQVSSAKAQFPNGEVEVKQTQTGFSSGALPLSLFSDDTEESNESLNLQNEVRMPTLSPGNTFSGQGPAISIHDLISNLYSQAPQITSSVDSVEKPDENGVCSPPEVTVITPLSGDDDWDDGSWEFKAALSENGVGEQLSTAINGNMFQNDSEIFPEFQNYTAFYDQLKDTLCFLLSWQLNEIKEARNSDAEVGNGGKAEALDNEIQEAFKLLEESEISVEVLSKKDLERNRCLNKFLEVLQQPKFNVIESNFPLSKRLELATNEWRVVAELLRHARSMLKILSLGSADEQFNYVSTWSKIIDVCVQELRYGAMIWKRASEKNVQHQILSDSRGQRYVQALGEIYKVVQLLGLSAKVYKPWILLGVSDSSQFFGILDECDALWSNSGLKEAIQNLSATVDFECSATAKAIIAAIKNVCDIDAVATHDHVFIQHKSICQLSLLPEEMLADLKTVMWGEKAYFSNLANLWANLISCDPPQLPHLQVS